MRLKNRFFWVAAVVSLILDQLSKYLVLQNLALNDTIPLLPNVFHFTYVLNPGAAFSFLQGAPWLRWLSLVVSIGLIALAWFGPVFNKFEQLGYGFILGGALGNGIDRFFNACIHKGQMVTCVVDFLDFRLIKFPVFNLADTFINVGIICLLIASFWQPAPSESRRR
jgi:signal peptidase II